MEGVTEYQTAEVSAEQESSNFATIGAVYEDGVTLLFDGQTDASEKHYKVNTSIQFAAGQRVKVIKDSGTYVVEYIVGNPGADVPGGGSGLPSGGTKGQVLKKASSTDGDAEWETMYGIPSGGTTGQILVKSNSTAGAASWDDNRSNSVVNQYYPTSYYDIQFRTSGNYGTPDFYIRFGSSGTWRKITLG